MRHRVCDVVIGRPGGCEPQADENEILGKLGETEADVDWQWSA